MANPTSNFGWQMPTNTDLVKDLPADFEVFGQAVDTSLMDLKGGTTGQVLSKASNTDMDFTWVAQDDSNAIQNALLTTTGDTIYASGASTPARLGIGTTGQVLTVSGGVPTWATPASGDKAALWMKSSGRYIKFHSRNINSNYTPLEDVTTYVPIYLPGYALDRIGFRTSTNATNTTWRLGIYNANSNGEPSTVYLDAGTVVATATSTTYEITISSTPPAGYYFLAINCQVTTSGSREILAYAQDTGMQSAPFAGASSLLTNSTYQSGWTQSGVTGAFATATSLSVYDSNLPVVAVRMA
jgi:hypothetical protein